MTVTRIDTVVVGGGQAGIATSEHLGKAGIPHVVLERARIAEAWRTSRWDSLVANGPAWHDRFPGMEFKTHPDGFPHKEEVAQYFTDYAAMIGAPVRTGVDVTRVTRADGAEGFVIETSDGTYAARNVVVATGPFQTPSIPPIAPEGLHQIHSSAYRNPAQLPEGGVLVVGAGSSGVQIAEELMKAGRQVYLSVGAHDRPPRAYRNRDFVWWLGVLGLWDLETKRPGSEHVTIAVSGADGGKTIDFRRLAHQGMTLVGATDHFDGLVAHFRDDLVKNVNDGDANYLALLADADAYVLRNGLDLPEEPEAKIIPADPDCMIHPIRSLDLKAEGITTIIWATGFRNDYSWLQVDTFDTTGKPKHQRGVGAERGIYFVGLPWLSRRGSAFIWGVWHDARHVADHILTQHKYVAYSGDGPLKS